MQTTTLFVQMYKSVIPRVLICSAAEQGSRLYLRTCSEDAL